MKVVRVYQDPGRAGTERRVLVDRLWPRGLRRDAVDFDQWAKDVAPSSALRRWYGHVPERFGEFARLYRAELTAEPAAAAVRELRKHARDEGLVLLTATRDLEHCGATVLREVLDGER